MQRIAQASADIPLAFVVEREGKDVALTVTPKMREIETPFGKNRVGLIGLTGSSKREDWQMKRFGPVEAVAQGVTETWYIAERTVVFIAGLIMGTESMDQVSGPIGTGYMAGKVATFGFAALMNLTAVLSVSVGLLNLLPIPMLDGGHLLFQLVEALKGKPLSERTQEYAFRLGFVMMIGLMLFTTINDSWKLLRG